MTSLYSRIHLNGTSRPLVPKCIIGRRKPAPSSWRARSQNKDTPGIDVGKKISQWAYDAGLETNTQLEDFLGDR